MCEKVSIFQIKTFRKPGEQLLKTTLKRLQEPQTPWKQNVKAGGVVSDF